MCQYNSSNPDSDRRGENRKLGERERAVMLPSASPNPWRNQLAALQASASVSSGEGTLSPRAPAGRAFGPYETLTGGPGRAAAAAVQQTGSSQVSCSEGIF
jgi:hypothetical protein